MYIKHANFQRHWFNYGLEKILEKIIDFSILNLHVPPKTLIQQEEEKLIRVGTERNVACLHLRQALRMKETGNETAA